MCHFWPGAQFVTAFLRADVSTDEVRLNPEHSEHMWIARADKPRGEEARTRRSRDGSWTKKGGKFSFGYKLHAKSDVDLVLIRDLETTTASVHDSRVDLSREGEGVYRDKGYFGVEPRGWDATMRRGVRGHPLGI